MAKPNYQYEKRQKDLSKKKKQEEMLKQQEIEREKEKKKLKEEKLRENEEEQQKLFDNCDENNQTNRESVEGNGKNESFFIL